MNDYEAFLAGERHEDVAMYLDGDALSDVDALTDHGVETDDGIVLVVDGDRGRSVFQSVANLDPMALASEARETDGTVRDDLTGGECPAAGDGDDHHARFVFAFSEAQNDEVDGLYQEGDVMHAYVACACGQTYSEKWLIDAGDATAG